jgi:DNA-binding MarR family transcriptional regulator
MRTREPLRDDPIGLARDNWCASGWPDAAEGMAIVTSIMRVQQILLADVEAVLKSFRLTFARYEVLMLLRFARRRSLPVGRIGARLQVHPASVTNAVDRLERDGLVERTQNPDDGRSVLASLTSAGAEVAEAATAVLNERVFSALPMSGDGRDELYRLLRDLRRAYGDFREPSHLL